MGNIPSNSLFVGYVLVFGLSALICLGSITRARRIDHTDTRRGLVALLALSGTWAASHVGFLLVPGPGLKRVFYHIGLLVGISTVGPWLYFCSAYTGRTLHDSTVLRRAAVGVFAVIALAKLTNPVHQLYFQAEFLLVPFPHLAIDSQPLHWLVMGLAYALAVVGYFMLFELFWQVGHDSRPLVVVVGLTGLPILFDAAGAISPVLINITYEPLGVAAFAVGLCFVFLEEFQTIRVAGEHDDPVIVLTDADEVRDYNTEAKELFPSLAMGEPIETVFPGIADQLAAEETVVEMDRVGGMRYYQLSVQPFSTDQSRLGRSVTLTDITDREQYRRELERQNERLEQFASMVSHDLRNPLNVAQMRLDLIREARDSEHVAAATTALDRMETLIEDVLSLARQGQPIQDPEPVSLSDVVHRGWGVIDSKDASLTVDSDGTLVADDTRLQQLFENLFRNAIEHGRDDVTVRVGLLGDGGFYVEDDGPGIPDADREEVFDSGYSSSPDGTGFGLAIVTEIVEAHGWEISVTDSATGGARFEVTGVEFQS